MESIHSRAVNANGCCVCRMTLWMLWAGELLNFRQMSDDERKQWIMEQARVAAANDDEINDDDECDVRVVVVTIGAGASWTAGQVSRAVHRIRPAAREVVSELDTRILTAPTGSALC